MYCYAQDVQLSSILSIGMAGIIAYRPIKQLAKINNHIQRATASAERVFEVMDVEDAIQEAPNAQDIANFANEIRFEKVTFSYDTATVLHDVSFTIKKGQFVAFVGGNGLRQDHDRQSTGALLRYRLAAQSRSMALICERSRSHRCASSSGL